jgi:putative colanic acid biosynthesis acetyltransferase WcaF
MSEPFERQLARFTGSGYDKGRNVLWQLAWMTISGALTMRWWCPVKVRIAILRVFGADIGDSVRIRHNVRIHWPWKLKVGDHSWIGEDAWILNLESVTIGRNVCISQGVLLCTGSHDRRSQTFEFDNGPILISSGAWIGARATILRGVNVGRGSTVGATALVTANVPAEAVLLAPLAEVVQGAPSPEQLFSPVGRDKRATKLSRTGWDRSV